MSTKIFDAWRINSTDIGELVKLGSEIREVQRKSFVDAVYNSLDFCQLAIIFAKKSVEDVEELRPVFASIAANVGMGASVQVRPKLSDLPQDAAELVLRKRELAELYGFVEQNYAHLLISGILFRSDCESKQKSIKAYHELYFALCEYIVRVSHCTDILYKAKGQHNDPLWIWDDDGTFTTAWTAQYHEDFNNTLSAMSHQEDELLQTISRSAAVLRDAFAAFSLDYRNDADGYGQRVLKEYQERMVKREC